MEDFKEFFLNFSDLRALRFSNPQKKDGLNMVLNHIIDIFRITDNETLAKKILYLIEDVREKYYYHVPFNNKFIYLLVKKESIERIIEEMVRDMVKYHILSNDNR